MKRYQNGIVAVLFLAGIPICAQADPLSMGQRMAERFLQGEIESVWSGSIQEMQDVFGSADALAAFRSEVAANFGTEEIVLSERTAEQGDLHVYTRISRWTEAPSPIRFDIVFDDADRIAGFSISPQPVAAQSPHLDYETKANLRLPVDGSWYVYWGGRTIEENYHAAYAGQRFAMDLLIMKNGQSHAGDPSLLDSYHCWDQPILAPANGSVARAIDGLPDQAIGASDPTNPAGNHVAIDFGNEEYGFLAHLQQGSVRVAEGDAVTAGQEIGLCGNSGNTSEPHLHFHMQTSPEFGQGEGLPAHFTNYRANGVLIHRGEPQKGENIQAVE